MTAICITHHGRLCAVVTFPYDPAAVAVIRGVPTRHWDPGSKEWSIPLEVVELAAEAFDRAGFPVAVDGKVWTSSRRTAPTADPVLAFFRHLPERLREPAFKALVRVLHPDGGGDVAVMQELNAARDADQ